MPNSREFTLAVSAQLRGHNDDDLSGVSGGFGSKSKKNAGTVPGNTIALDASAGYVRPYWARTMESFRRRVWCSASLPRTRPAATCLSRALRAWLLGLCRWPPVSTCLCTHRQTPNMPTSSASAGNLIADDKGEHRELAAIYVARGLDPSLAKQVAQQLMAHDALGAHARDELGISKTFSAHPIQAALASAGSFAVGAALPLMVTAIVPERTSDLPRFWSFTVLSRASRRVGRARWGRGPCSGGDPGHVLGRAGHGDYGRRRGALRDRGLRRPLAVLFLLIL